MRQRGVGGAVVHPRVPPVHPEEAEVPPLPAHGRIFGRKKEKSNHVRNFSSDTHAFYYTPFYYYYL